MRARRYRIGLAALGGLALLAAATALAGSYANTSPIVAQDATSTSPPTQILHPVTSTINVSEAGTVQPGSMSITLFDVVSEWPDDLDIYLTNPAGTTSVMLWSDAGGDNTSDVPPSPEIPIPEPGVDVTFSDSASQSLPDENANGPITTASYKPTNHSGNPDFSCNDPDPTLPGSVGTALSAFDNQNVQGNWTLTVVDDCVGSNSKINGGWRLIVNTPTAVRVRALSATRIAGGVAVRWATGDESDVAGYNVYRGKVRVNANLVRAKASGTARGASYRLVDRRAGKLGSYRLEIVHLNGSRTSGGLVTYGRF